MANQEFGSNVRDDGAHPKRTGTAWTATVHIIKALIGSGILSLAWDIAQLGWIFGPAVIFLFSVVTCYTSSLLASSCHSGEEGNRIRNYNYMDAVKSNLGGIKPIIFGLVFYLYLYGIVIDYSTETINSMTALWSPDYSDHTGDCNVNRNFSYIIFGIIQILLSQIPGFDHYPFVAIVNTIICFTYPTIAIGLSIAKVAGTGNFKGSLNGIGIGTVTAFQKIGRTFKALGQIAFAYSFFNVFFEIQDTIRFLPSNANPMTMASHLGIGATTILYMLCGCFGYAAFGDLAPTNLLAGFGSGSSKRNWLADIANGALLIHLIGSYQRFSQPLFEFVEDIADKRFRGSKFFDKQIKVPIPGFQPYNLKPFHLVWRIISVIITTVISMFIPFSNEWDGVTGAIGFWVLTIYFPIEIYTAQKKIPKWSSKWVCFQILNFATLIITIAAAAGFIAGAVLGPKS